MSRARRLLLVAVAWACPLAWFAAALLTGPVDGATLESRGVGLARGTWSDPVRVGRTFGDTPLRSGDLVTLVDGRTVTEWLRDGAPEREVGEVVTYRVQRPGTALDVELDVEVRLVRYPAVAAARAEPAALVLVGGLLVTGSLVFWRRPGTASGRAFLAGTALLPCALTASPWGLGPIDLAGGRGVWPHAVGEALAAAGVGCMLLAVLALTSGGPLPGRRAAVAAYGVPVVGYLVWLAVALGGDDDPLTRVQSAATVLAPALLACLPVAVLAASVAHRRTREREELLATRLVVLGVGTVVVAWTMLEVLPRAVSRDPAVPGPVLALLLLPVLLGSLGVAVSGYRITEIEPTVRRGLVQGAGVALVGAAFVGLVGALDVASDVAVGSMLVGGLAALLLLPVGIGLQRRVRGLVYGDREFPGRVVSDLRRLDTLGAPEEALRETLDLLARRLHLSHAAIEVFATGTSEAVRISVGEARGSPVTVDLAAGGSTLGVLRLEVDPGRDPFGPGDRLLLEEVGAQVGALVQAVSSNKELQHSRERLITAREEERRRIRRDLHDGLGPSLASMAMQLEAAEDLIAEDPDRAAALVARLSDRAREEISEVRRLVDGLRPPALDQLGLVSALRQRARDHPPGGRPGGPASGMSWYVEAADDVEPLPAAVEVAAFRIVVEAVNNAARHGGARTCAVTLERERSALRVRVHDDGRGLAADHEAGVGLFSMRERAQELGGTCTVSSTEGDGTTVEAVLPLGEGAGRGSGGGPVGSRG
jgi:two-component system, NarL family, sensor kinase